MNLGGSLSQESDVFWYCSFGLLKGKEQCIFWPDLDSVSRILMLPFVAFISFPPVRGFVWKVVSFKWRLWNFVNVLVIFAKSFRKDLDLTCWLSCFTVQRACQSLAWILLAESFMGLQGPWNENCSKKHRNDVELASFPISPWFACLG